MITAPRTLALSLSLLAWLMAGCSADPTTATAPEDDTGAPVAQDAPAEDAPAEDASVQMADTAFSPASVSVAVGSTVTWTNDDSLPHTVAFADGGPEDSDVIDPSGTFETTFEEAGSYPYVCSLHPGMEGTVEVGA